MTINSGFFLRVLGLGIGLLTIAPVTVTFAEDRTEIIIVADHTPEGQEFISPTPENPATYILVSAGAKELGSVSANEKIPASTEIEPQLRDVLRKQNYRPATPTRPEASLLIVYSWGVMLPSTLQTSLSRPATMTNQSSLLGLIGSDKLDLSRFNLEREFYFSQTTDGRYFLLVGAYDYAAFQRGEKRMLWRARLSISRLRTNLATAIPLLLSAGGQFLGQDHNKPLVVPTHLPSTKVHSGNPVMKGFLEK